MKDVNIIYTSPNLEAMRAQMFFINQQRKAWLDAKPWAGGTLYHNIPLTQNTLLKIEALALGGARVVVDWVKVVPPCPKALAILQQNTHPLITLAKPNSVETFDWHLDCCGELASKRPHRGAVELTQSGDEVYKSMPLNYPVVSVNQSFLKELETIGTGISCALAFEQLTDESIRHKKVVVLGCGKVGRGVVSALMQRKAKVTVVENNAALLTKLQKNGIEVIAFEDGAALNQLIACADVIVSATGHANFVSTHILSGHFALEGFEHTHLMNMGALDEFGTCFSKEAVLFDKQPVNFCLENPTVLAFIDPLLYAHSEALNDVEAATRPGMHCFSDDRAVAIVRQWFQSMQAVNSEWYDGAMFYLELMQGIFDDRLSIYC